MRQCRGGRCRGACRSVTVGVLLTGGRLDGAGISVALLGSASKWGGPALGLRPISSGPGDAPMTPAGLAALRAEVERLKTVERPAIAARIKTAREWGDLKENAEYHDAKNSQALLERRIAVLDDTLLRAVAVEADGGAEAVAFGSTVHVVDEDSGRAARYTLVGATEAKASEGRLSVDSPVARALLGARPGDVVPVPTPGGERRLRVELLGD